MRIYMLNKLSKFICIETTLIKRRSVIDKETKCYLLF